MDGLCRCRHDTFGYRCEFNSTDVCLELATEGQTSPFPMDPFNWAVRSTKYTIFIDPETGHPLSNRNMPIFYTYDSAPANFIFFSGRRWILAGERPIVEAILGEEQAYSGHNFPNVTAQVFKQIDEFIGVCEK